NRVLRSGPLIPEVELLGNRVAILRVHEPACGTIDQRCQWRRDGRIWVHAVAPVAQGNAGPGNGVRWRGEGKQALVDRGVGLLNHEQRYVLEDVAKIQTIPAAQDVFSVTSEVIGKANARAEVMVVVVRKHCVGI